MVEDIALKLNDLARHQMMTKLLNDILFDLQVCRIEGFDPTIYIREIKKEVDDIYFKLNKDDKFR